jgi:hypothetical protein
MRTCPRGITRLLSSVPHMRLGTQHERHRFKRCSCSSNPFVLQATCGHMCGQPCGQPCGSLVSRVASLATSKPCGHLCDQPCCQSCGQPSDQLCGQHCDQPCGQPCGQPCDQPRDQPCFQSCGQPCDQPHPPRQTLRNGSDGDSLAAPLLTSASSTTFARELRMHASSRGCSCPNRGSCAGTISGMLVPNHFTVVLI